MKKAAYQATSHDFLVTAFYLARGRKRKIRVEVKGPRSKGRLAWKRTQSFFTEKDAIQYIREQRQLFDEDKTGQKAGRDER